MFFWTARLYGLLALLTLLWNYLFFGAHAIGASVWVAIAATLAILVIILRVRRTSARAAMYLVPFLIWGIFATYLVHVIALMNP